MRLPIYLASTLFGTLTAQQNLTLDTWANPNVGWSYKYRTLNQTEDPGPGGQAQAWDFSTLGSGTAQEVQALDPASVNEASAYPQATHVIDNGLNLSVYEMNQNGWTLHALGQALFFLDCSAPMTELEFPMEYNDQGFDLFSCSFDFQGNSFSRSGTVNFKVDGTGSLQLPGGQSFDRVLRVRTEENSLDQGNFGGFPIVNTNENITYRFFAENRPYPVLILTSLTSDLLPIDVQTVQYLDPDFAGQDQLPGMEGIRMVHAPNPHLDLSAWNGGALNVRLMDLQGRVLSEYSLQGQEGLWEIPSSDRSAGLYLVEVSGEMGRMRFRAMMNGE